MPPPRIIAINGVFLTSVLSLKMPSCIYGFWKIFLFEKEDAPDQEDVDDKSKVPPHPFLKSYWGDIDDETFIHLFNGPRVDYSPVKLISKDVMFKDHDDVSFYLIHLFIYSLNNIIIYQK